MKSVITCDMEGVIETFSKGAEEVFGYNKEELVGIKRVSLFSPGEIVLQNVAYWLEQASKNGEYVTDTIFVRKDGKKFGAKIRITPTFANGKDKPQTGYCGVTEPVDQEVQVPIKFTTKLIKALAITRMPFLSAALGPVFIGGAYAYNHAMGMSSFNGWHFFLVALGVSLLHLASNVLNDYFDVKDGTDDANTQYFTQFTGGSRAIELGLISLENTKRLGIALLVAAFAVGSYLTYLTDVKTLWLGLAGAFMGVFYTAPPFRLVARKGLGELTIAMAFGSMVTLGTVYVMAGTMDPIAFLLGLPAGLLTANILLINEFPDADSDAKTGKNHLVVTFGKEKSLGIYLGILVLSVASYLAIFYLLPTMNFGILAVALLTFAAGSMIYQNIKRDYNTRELVKSNVHTIILSSLSSLAFALVLYFL
jgi:1,4-dihydroxy-2-naphthoate polyprenyltransferase